MGSLVLDWKRKLFINPIISRETIDILRKPRSYVLLFFLLSLLSFFLVLSWPDTNINGSTTQYAVKIFRVFGVAQLVLLPLFTSIITAQCLTSERENGTLEILATTIISPVSIIIGKVFSNVAFALIMSMATLPLLSMCFQLGGVGADEILGIYVSTFKYVIILTSVGIVCSALMKKTLISTGSTLVISLITLGCAATSALSSPDYFRIANHINILFLGPAFFFLSIFIILVTKGLNPENIGDHDNVEDKASAFIVNFDQNNFPDNMLSGIPLPEGSNPVLQKELGTGEVIGNNNYIRFFLVASMFVAAFLLISSFEGENSNNSGAIIFYTYILFFTGIITPSLAGNSMAKELQARTYDILCTTPMKYGDIISGKVKAALYYTTLLVFIVFGPCSFGAMVSGQYGFGTLIKFGIALIVFNIMESILAINISLRSKSMSKTSVITLLMIVTLLVLPPMSFWYYGAGITDALTVDNTTSIIDSVKAFSLKAFLCISPGSWVMTEYSVLKARSLQNSLFFWNLLFNIFFSMLLYADCVRKGYFRDE